MNSIKPIPEVQRDLSDVQHRLAELHRERAALEGRRDSLIMQLASADGADRGRFSQNRPSAR